MAIPESQLETWSHQGSVTQSSSTYQTIRNALMASAALYADKDFKTFLQGSYGNDTNIYAESDVDVVIRLDSIFNYDISGLPSEQQTAFNNVFATNAVYTFAEFNQGVSTRLRTAFGDGDVTFGTKAYRIKANGSRRNADVVACYQHRRYTRFVSTSDNSYVPGIILPITSGGRIINYPAAHSDNCTSKHQATNSWFKPVVRIFKNMRTKLVNDKKIDSKCAPSYYIEGLIYNVPNDQFGKTYAETVVNCINWLYKADKTKLLCANQEYCLLGNSNVQWVSGQCDNFLAALVTLWNEWGI